jgi:DNA-binding PadR family transcriptional regulator
MLTRLEEHVLMTVWKLDGNGYGVSIFEALKDLTDSRLSMGVVYDVLDRLTKTGRVDSRMGESTPIRGGMRKKHYRITAAGIEELIQAKSTHDKIMEGFWEKVREYRQTQDGHK